MTLSNPHAAGVGDVSHGFAYDFSFVFVPALGTRGGVGGGGVRVRTRVGAAPALRDDPQGALIAEVSQACQGSCKAATAFYACYCPCFKLALQVCSRMSICICACFELELSLRARLFPYTRLLQCVCVHCGSLRVSNMRSRMRVFHGCACRSPYSYAPTVQAACCGFDLCYQYIWFFGIVFVFALTFRAQGDAVPWAANIKCYV